MTVTLSPHLADAPGLPGLGLPGRLPGTAPRALLAPGTLLLRGVTPGRSVDLATHRRAWGAQPEMTLPEFVATAERERLLGAGGAEFPASRKLAAMAGRAVSLVVVNASEGEPTSGKDAVLIAHVPHLVLDGAVAVAGALGAREVILRVSENRPDLMPVLETAIGQRPVTRVAIRVSVGPDRFVAGEATAVVNALAGGPATPKDLGLPPTLPHRRLRPRSAVYVSNVETYARLAVATRGLSASSALISVSGAVANPGVLEVDNDLTLDGAASMAGGLRGTPTVLITGGWHGAWVPWSPATAHVRLTRRAIADAGGRWGAGSFVWVPGHLHGEDVLAAIVDVLAGGSARQCGPCARGLPELARLLGEPATPDRRDTVAGLLTELDGRGLLCSHPSASVAAIRSALGLLDDQVTRS